MKVQFLQQREPLINTTLLQRMQEQVQPELVSNNVEQGNGKAPKVDESAPQQQRTRKKNMCVDDKDEGWCRNKKYIEKVENGFMCTVCRKVYGVFVFKELLSHSASQVVTTASVTTSQSTIAILQFVARSTVVNSRHARRGTYTSTSTIVMQCHCRRASISVRSPRSNLHMRFFIAASRSCPFCRHIAKSPAMLEKHIT